MSNIALLAQATLPTTMPTNRLVVEVAFVLMLCIGSIWSAQAILRRRLYLIPPVPSEDSAPPWTVLLGTAAAAVCMYLIVLSVCAHQMGIEKSDTPEAVRQLTFCQPAAQLLTAGLIVAMLTPWMPQALHWTTQRTRILRRAAGGYLLAIPWVLLLGALIAIIVEHFGLKEEKQHIIFKIWRNEGPGLTPFKIVAMSSAILGASLAEELFFRGIVQRLVHRLTGNVYGAIVVASLMFTATHSPWTTQPSIFLLSIFLGVIYFRTGSILVPIVMHALFNAMQFALFLATVE